MGGCAARRQIGSGTSNGEGQLGVLEEIRGMHGLFLELDDDDQEEARQDERIRRNWSLELSQHAQVMDMSPYSSSLSPQQHGSRTKNSA